MATSISTKRGFLLPGGEVSDKRLNDIQAVKSALIAIDTDLANLQIYPQNSQSVNYTTVLSDSAKHIFHPSTDVAARTFTIPANTAVAYPIGTTITFVNNNGAGAVSIAITTDTMRLAGPGTTGTRVLAANGVATILKVSATEWFISGTGIS